MLQLRVRATTVLFIASLALGAFGLVCGAYSPQCPRSAAISTGLLGIVGGGIVALIDRASDGTRKWWDTRRRRRAPLPGPDGHAGGEDAPPSQRASEESAPRVRRRRPRRQVDPGVEISITPPTPSDSESEEDFSDRSSIGLTITPPDA